MDRHTRRTRRRQRLRLSAQPPPSPCDRLARPGVAPITCPAVAGHHSTRAKEFGSSLSVAEPSEPTTRGVSVYVRTASVTWQRTFSKESPGGTGIFTRRVSTMLLSSEYRATKSASFPAGKLALFVARYSDDNNIVETRRVKIPVPPGLSFENVRCHVTDAVRTYTETPLVVGSDGSATLKLEPNSFALVEW